MTEIERPMDASDDWDALNILHNMALERDVSFFRRCFRRWWYIADEPLRNDAANLLRRVGYEAKKPMGTKYVGE